MDPRFGLGMGAFFAAIANNTLVGTSLPPVGRFSLGDGQRPGPGDDLSYLGPVDHLPIYRRYDGSEKVRRFFDKVSFTVFLIGYTATNLLLPLAAKS